MLAQEDSRVLGYDYIGTEHLLLGIMHEEHGVGALVLADIDLDLETLSNKAIEMIPPAGKVPPGHIPFTNKCKRVIENALREALQLGHNYIGTEHLLLGLIREENPGADVLEEASGLSRKEVRQAVIKRLSRYGDSPKAGLPAKPDPWGDYLRRQIVIESERPRSRMESLRRALDAHSEP